MLTGRFPLARAIAVAVFLAVSTSGTTKGQAQASAPPVEEVLRWLDQRETEWVATAHLQRQPEAAIPLLLAPERAKVGPHGDWTPALLALAKIGEPAIPAILEQFETARRGGDPSRVNWQALVKVLAAIGPPAVPALVEIADMAPTLAEVARMEPGLPTHYSVLLSPWASWRPADDRVSRLQQAVVPLLPRISAILDAGVREWKPSDSPYHLPAAYLLARWGTGEMRTRGRQALEHVATTSDFFHRGESIRWLQALKDPLTAELIRLTVPTVPANHELTSSYLLSLAVALQQVGGKDYGPLVDDAIRLGRPGDRIDAVRFLGTTEDLFNVPRLVRLLDDRTTWNHQIVGNVALDSLRRLTFEDLPPDAKAWDAWWARHRNVQRGTLLERWMAAKGESFASVPMWQANAWIARLFFTTDPRVLPAIGNYVRRKDLDPRATGPGRSNEYSVGDGAKLFSSPPVVALLLRLAQLGVPGAVKGLEQCLDAASDEIRSFGALALGAYQRSRAADALARELSAPPDSGVRDVYAGFLLDLGDRRGLPIRLEAFGAERFGSDEAGRAVRLFACRDLRIHTQQPLPCDADASPAVRAAQAAAWRNWWRVQGGSFRLPGRAAALDLEAFPMISPITIGTRIAR